MTIASIGDGVIVTDPQGRIQTINAVAEQLTGWKQDKAESKSIEEVFQVIGAAREKVENPVLRAIREGHVSGSVNQSIFWEETATRFQLRTPQHPFAETRVKSLVSFL